MIPFFGVYSTKQTMLNQNVGFGYKTFAWARSDGYSYHIAPYSVAEGVGRQQEII